MKQFEKRIADYMTNECGLTTPCRVVVAVSGGADSVALLLIFRSLGFDCVVAHCNFGLRGEESDRDEAFVRDLCRKLGLIPVVSYFDVVVRCRETGESVEMACRSLRYEWFEALRKERDCDVIAVAHHRDDNVETFFLNTLRGSGVAGLKAMLPRSGQLVRPLLCANRSEIEEYLKRHGADFVTDSTNGENLFRRNRLRNIIIPALEREFPGGSERIAATVDCLRDNYFMFRDYIRILHDKYVSADGNVAVANIVAEVQHPVQVIYELARNEGVTRQMALIIAENPSASGTMFGNYTLDRGMLKPLAPVEKFNAILTPGMIPLMMERGAVTEFKPTRNPMMAWFDPSVLDGNPVFEVRSWQNGDRFRPFGLKGNKKVSDLFANLKLDENQKRAARIVTRNGKIIWIPGMRQSALFPVTDKSKEYIEFQWIEK